MTVSQPTGGHGGTARTDEETTMVNGWDLDRPECGNPDADKVTRIAFAFRCECGSVWDRSNATSVGLWDVPPDATDDVLDALAQAIVDRMNARAEGQR